MQHFRIFERFKVKLIGSISWINIVFFILLTITIVSEIFVIDQNLKFKKRIDAYHHLENLLWELQSYNDMISYEREFEGKCLPLYSDHSFLASTRFLHQMNSSKFVVLFFFSMNDLTPYLIKEINRWSNFAQIYEHKICQVIGITDKISHAITNEVYPDLIEFSLFEEPKLQNILNEYGLKSTPAIFFGDVNSKRTIYAFFPTAQSLSNQDFENKIHEFLQACKS